VAQRRKAEGQDGAVHEAAHEVIKRQAGINDGKGFVFISHTGEIYPSGFLPLAAGNVRRDSLTAVYRESPLFRTLRNADNLQGKCGECEYRNLCGGSRSRSYVCSAKNRSGTHAATFSSQYSWWRPPRIAVLRTL
jgi:AdoMet-dependent heme synthase